MPPCIRRVLAEAKAIGCEEPPYRMASILVGFALMLVALFGIIPE